MFQKIYSKNKEIWDILITLLVLGFSFSFYFFTDVYLGTYLYIFGLVVVSFLVFLLAQRYWAKRNDFEVGYRIWWVFAILALILTFLTSGAVVFAVLGVVGLKKFGRFRIGYKKPHVGPYDEAKAAVMGPLANTFLAVFSALLFNASGAQIWNNLMIINIWMALFNMFPFFRFIPLLYSRVLTLSSLKKNIHYTNGEIIFFGSRPLWVFSFAFIAATSWLLLTQSSVFLAVVASFFIGFGFYLLIHFFVEPRERSPSG